MKLFVCGDCGRHVKDNRQCPFCASRIEGSPCLDTTVTVGRLARIAVVASTVVLANCTGDAYGCPPPPPYTGCMYGGADASTPHDATDDVVSDGITVDGSKDASTDESADATPD